MKQSPNVHMCFGNLDIDFGQDGVVIVRCVEDEQVTAYVLHRVRGQWRVDENTVDLDDLPRYPSVMNH